MKAGSQAETAFNRDERIGEKINKHKYKKVWKRGGLVAFKIAISLQAQKYMKSLDRPDARKIKAHINELRQNPYTPRPQCDILKEKGKRPPLYRMRVGKHRVEFFIEEETIFISRIFQRSGDSDYS